MTQPQILIRDIVESYGEGMIKDISTIDHQDITIGVIQSWSKGYIVSKEESCP